MYLGKLECRGVDHNLGSLFDSHEMDPDKGWYLEDEFDEALRRLQEHYPNLDGPFTRTLITPRREYDSYGYLMKIKTESSTLR